MRRSNKDILIGLIQTLNDKKCKDIYFAIQDMDKPPRDLKEFGKVRLTIEQYSRLLELWGEDKLNKCIEILDKWLNKITPRKFISHFRMLIGWVDDEYRKQSGSKDNTMSFDKIDTTWKARKYVRSIPQELIPYSADVKFLVDRFGTEILQ